MKRKLIIGADLWKERIVATIICIVLNLDKGAKDIIQNLASFRHYILTYILTLVGWYSLMRFKMNTKNCWGIKVGSEVP